MIFLAVFLMLLTVASFAYFVVPAWDEVAGYYVKDLTPQLEALDVDEDHVTNLMRWWGISLVAVLFFIGVIWGKYFIAIGILVIAFTLPRPILDQMIKSRRIRLRDQLVSASISLANTTRAGLTPAQGFGNICNDVPDPLGNEFRRIVSNYESGQPLKQAIREVKQRLDLEAFNIFASAVLIAIEQGGNISRALDKISEGLAELQRLERKIETASAGGRRLAFVLALFPPGFLLGFYVLDPVSVGMLFETLIGQLILVVIGFLVYIAVKMCAKILDIEV